MTLTDKQNGNVMENNDGSNYKDYKCFIFPGESHPLGLKAGLGIRPFAHFAQIK